ncbi:MAG TPA: DUF4445 domain-containing protein [Desulfobulbaceae bacterium]|nr:DUF4445 domain-containing protein [Desulfobulbaceae bacterium]
MQQNNKDFPLVTSVGVVAEPPSLQDNTADLDRLHAAVSRSLPEKLATRPLTIPFQVMAGLGRRFRRAGFSGHALINVAPHQLTIVDFLKTNPKKIPAMALDLGTTHLEATLIDLVSGNNLAHTHGPNAQMQYGADILSRIHYAAGKASGQNGLLKLQHAAVDSINLLIEALGEEAGIEPEYIRAISVSGNTTMVHLLLGLSPYHICREPYTPMTGAPDPFFAAEIGLRINKQALVWVLPNIGSYFGGDLISGILASGLDEMEKTSMLIDVGTNAEVVLGNKDWLIACAGAAGPALEGGVARMGMRAGPGAIEHVRLDRENWQLTVSTIDDQPAVGICGSGLIELVAELYLARVVDLRGKLCRDTVSGTKKRRDFICKHLLETEEGLVFVVTSAETSGHGRPVVLAQVDLDAMMRSKAAMYAILATLVSQVGVEFSDLDRIYVAGAFGKHIDPGSAITLGMLPDLPIATYVSVGNSSLHGAELVLLSEKARIRSREIRRKITYIELNVNQEFMLRFSGSRFIPHTDPHLFPSVPIFSREDPGRNG